MEIDLGIIEFVGLAQAEALHAGMIFVGVLELVIAFHAYTEIVLRFLHFMSFERADQCIEVSIDEFKCDAIEWFEVVADGELEFWEELEYLAPRGHVIQFVS